MAGSSALPRRPLRPPPPQTDAVRWYSLPRGLLRPFQRVEIFRIRHISLDVALVGAVVLRQGANEGVRRLLLKHVRRPPGDPGGNEQWREGRGVESHKVVRRARWVIKVGVNPLSRNKLLFQGAVHIRNVLAAIVFDEGIEGLLHRRYPGGAAVVAPVCECTEPTAP